MTDSEHEPVESARPTLGRRDQPDALRPDTDPDDGPDHKLPPDQDTPRPAPPPGQDAQR